MKKYLLSTGLTTTKIEEYILDLFELYLKVNPGDIPFKSEIGFNFTLTNVMKDDLEREIVYRVNSLVERIKTHIPSVPISAESIRLIDEQRVHVILKVNGSLYDGLDINLV